MEHNKVQQAALISSWLTELLLWQPDSEAILMLSDRSRG
jgi:hypothetical protein